MGTLGRFLGHVSVAEGHPPRRDGALWLSLDCGTSAELGVRLHMRGIFREPGRDRLTRCAPGFRRHSPSRRPEIQGRQQWRSGWQQRPCVSRHIYARFFLRHQYHSQVAQLDTLCLWHRSHGRYSIQQQQLLSQRRRKQVFWKRMAALDSRDRLDSPLSASDHRHYLQQQPDLDLLALQHRPLWPEPRAAHIWLLTEPLWRQSRVGHQCVCRRREPCDYRQGAQDTRDVDRLSPDTLLQRRLQAVILINLKLATKWNTK